MKNDLDKSTGEWGLLEEYCMQDTKLTHAISSRNGLIKLPLTSLRKSGEKKEAFLDHEYCDKTHRHTRIQRLFVGL